MAKQLDISDGTTTVNILNGVFNLVDGGWNTQQSDEPVWEVFTLAAKGTDAAIRTEQDKLDKLVEAARIYLNDFQEKTPIYLRVMSEGETLRRAVILDAAVQYGSDMNISPLLGTNMASSETLGTVVLGILRAPEFENASPIAGIGITSVGVNGGVWLPANAAGTIDARIKQFSLTSADGSQALTKLWIGIRRLRYGTTHFEPKWECESGTMHIADTTVVGDGTASGSNKVQCTFATNAALAKRFTVTWANVKGVNANKDIIGDYLVLGRVKLSAGTVEARVVLKHGWSGLGFVNDIGGDVYLSAISNANLVNWNLVELGRVQIPSSGNRDGVSDTTIGAYALTVWAERISASGSIDFDEFLLIPIDGLAVLEQTNMYASGGGSSIYTSPLNEQYILSLVSGGDTINSLGALLNWYYPSGAGVLVFAGNESDRHVLTRTVAPTMTIHPRYRMFLV